MSQKAVCPRCGSAKIWELSSGKRRCAACRYDFRLGKLGLQLTPFQWRQVLHWFLRGLSVAQIAEETGLRRERIMRALLLVHQAMARDVPPVFSGVVEVDETYLVGPWHNKRLSVRLQGTKAGRGTTKQAVFGILCRGGQVWAEVVPDTKSKTLLPLLQQQVCRGSVVCTDTFSADTGVAAGGYVHRMVDHRQTHSGKRGGHINGLEGFWGYLKRRLAAKGGIRRERLPLYLAEYVWRYNNRHLTVQKQGQKILKLMQS